MTKEKQIEYFKGCLMATGREGVEDLLDFIEELGFYDAPASGGNHCCKDGGLLEHTVNVMQYAEKIGLTLLGTNNNFKLVYDTRKAMKKKQVAAAKVGRKAEAKQWKKAQLPYKKMLNALSGAMKDETNAAYDPRNNNCMCINGQLMLLDLIEHLEVVPGLELIQSNTDGLIIWIPDTDEAFEMVDDICWEWEQRCSTEQCSILLELDNISEIYQKDVNNYLSVYVTVMVPEEEYITQTENQSAMYATIDAKKGEDKQVKEYIDKNVLKENDMINVFSVLDMKASFRRFVSKYYMIGSFLVVILAFIGIMNFFNTTATSVISRKKELALLEVVGMTKKQISKMLVAEGFLYLGGAFMIAVLLVVVGAKQILINTLGTAFFFRLHLTIVPCVLMIPILVGIAYVIPKYQFEKMSRESVVERIRKE